MENRNDSVIGSDDLDAGIRGAFGSEGSTSEGPPSVLHQLFGDSDSAPRVLLRATSGSTTGGAVAPSESRYEIEGEIARGGMGVVLRGQDVDLGREVAVKVIRPELADHPIALQRFIEEAQIAGQLQHPGVIPVYELGVQGDRRVFFSMKLIEGKTMAALLAEREDPRRGHAQLIGIFEQVCQTVAYAHSKGVIHRDLKPANVLIGAFGEVQVADWGFAKVLARSRDGDSEGHVVQTARGESGADLSQAGSVMGTPSYMAPEQARGDSAKVDERADVFALGAMLLEILTGKPPYPADHKAILRAARGDLQEPLARLERSGGHPDLIALCNRCLWADREARPRNAAEVVEALTAHRLGVEERAQAAVIAAAEAEVRASEERRRRRLTLALAGTVVAALVVGAVGYFWVADSEEQRRREGRDVVLNEIGEAERLAGGADLEHVARWDDAEAAARRALTLAVRHGVDADTRARAQRVAEEFDERATRSRRNAAALLRIERIRTNRADERQLLAMDHGYADVFADLSIGAESADVESAVARLTETGIGSRLVEALDEWIWLRSMVGREVAHLVRISDLVDPDPWRQRLRRAGVERDAGTLRTLAENPPLEGSSPTLLALYLSRMGDHDTAVSVLARAHRQRPDDLWVNYGLGVELSLVSPPRYAAAVSYLRVAVAARPDMAGLRTRLGITLCRAGHLGPAIESFEDAVAKADSHGTNSLPIYEILIETHEADGSLDALIQRYRASAEAKPDDVVTQGRLGRALLLASKTDEAIARLERAAELEPAVMEHEGWVILALLIAGRTEDAWSRVGRDLERAPDHPPLNWIASNVLAVQGRFLEGLERVEKAMRGDPYRLDYLVTHASLHRRLGNLAAAKASFERGLAIRPDFGELKRGEAQLHFLEGDVEVAERLYREAIAAPERRLGGRFTLYTIDGANPSTGLSVMSARLATNDPVFESWGRLGALNAQQGLLAKAAEAWAEQLRRAPKDIAWLPSGNLAMAQQMLGNHARAHELAEDCFRNLPSEDMVAFPLNMRAWSALALGLPAEQAREDLYRVFAIQTGRTASEMKPLVDELVRLALHRQAIVDGTYEFESPLERLRAAWMLQDCLARTHQACLLAEAALQEDPSLGHVGAVTPTTFHWIAWVGQFAAQAATGQGVDARDLSDRERVRLRRIALDSMKDHVAYIWARNEAGDEGYEKDPVRGQLHQLFHMPHYGGVRHPNQRKAFPPEEQVEWEAFWKDARTKLDALRDGK